MSALQKLHHLCVLLTLHQPVDTLQPCLATLPAHAPQTSACRRHRNSKNLTNNFFLKQLVQKLNSGQARFRAWKELKGTDGGASGEEE